MSLLTQRDLFEVNDAKDRASLEQMLLRCAQRLEFGIVSAAVMIEQPGTSSHIFTAGNIPKGFEERSRDSKSVKRDPVMRGMMASSRPVLYDQGVYVDSGVGDLWEEQAAFGYRSGVSIGLHLPGGKHFFFGLDREQPLPPPDSGLVQLMADVNLFAQYAQEAAMRVLPEGLAPPLPVKRLSPREREVLQWSAMGKTAWEVSQIVGISESTVDFHVRNAMTKLGATNKNSAVARATSLGLL